MSLPYTVKFLYKGKVILEFCGPIIPCLNEEIESKGMIYKIDNIIHNYDDVLPDGSDNVEIYLK